MATDEPAHDDRSNLARKDLKPLEHSLERGTNRGERHQPSDGAKLLGGRGHILYDAIPYYTVTILCYTKGKSHNSDSTGAPSVRSSAAS